MEQDGTPKSPDSESKKTSYLWHRILEIVFGSIAKLTMGVMVVVAFILFFPESLFTAIPTNRKEWGIFLILLILGIAGTVLWLSFKKNTAFFE